MVEAPFIDFPKFLYEIFEEFIASNKLLNAFWLLQKNLAYLIENQINVFGKLKPY